MNLRCCCWFLGAGILALLSIKHGHCDVLKPLEYTYLSGVPKGHISYTFTTRPKPINVQINGSLKPLTLLLNGVQINLKGLEVIAGPSKEKDSVYVNGSKIELIGRGSYFYLEKEILKQEGFLKIDLEVNGKKYNYSEKLNNIKFDFPITKTIYKPIVEDKGLFDLYIKYIPLENTKLNLDGLSHINSILSIKDLPVGMGAITGEYQVLGINKLWHRRIVSLPYDIERRSHGPDKLILALETVKLENIDIVNDYIRGYTNPGNTIQFGNEEVEVKSDGTFEISFGPKMKTTKSFIIVVRNGLTKRFEFEVNCPDYHKGNPWYYPKQSDKEFVELSLVDEGFRSSDDLNISNRGEFDRKFYTNVYLGKWRDYTVSVSYERRRTYNLYDSQSSLKIYNDHTLGFQAHKTRDWGWYYGAGLGLQQVDYKRAGNSCNFCEDIQSFGLIGNVFLARSFRLPIKFRHIELTPKLFLKYPVTKMFYTFHYGIEYFNLKFIY